MNFEVDDQKNFQGDINTLSTEDRVKIANKCYSDAGKVNNARRLENEKDHEGSIKIWREVLGSEFPNYG